MHRNFVTFLAFLALSSVPALAQVSPAPIARAADVKSSRSFIYHGKLVRPNGSTPNGSVQVTLKILSPDPNLCVLWAETQTITVDNGGFSLELGHTVNRISGAAGGAANDFKQVFVNNAGLTISGAQCASGNSYTPSSSDDRLLSAAFNDGGEVVEIAGLPIKSVPFALQAEEIGGYGLANLVKISGVGSAVTFTPVQIDELKLQSDTALPFDMKTRQVKNAADPVDPQDLVTKAYYQANLPTGTGVGSVTNVSVSGSPLSVTNGTTTPNISLSQASATTDGYLSSANWNTFNDKLTSGLSVGQVFIGNGSNVAAPGYFGIGQMRNNIGTLQMPTACTASQTLTWSAVTDVLACTNISGLNADKITAGTLATARLGSGTADGTTYLRGDQTWAALPAGADHLGNHTATTNLNLGTFQLVGNGGSAGIAIDAAGRIGIGTSSPGNKLEVIGSTWFNGNSAAGGTAPDSNILLNVNSNVTNPAARTYGGYFQRNLVSSAPNNQEIIGISGIGSTVSGAFNHTNRILGGAFTGQHGVSATASQVTGMLGTLYNLGTGIITDGRAGHFRIINENAGGSITNAYGAVADIWYNNGTVTNTYGFYVGDLTSGTQTNTPFSFYASDSGALSYFAGNVGIGTTSPSEKLEVVGGKIKSPEFCIGASCITAWPSGAGGTVTSVGVGGLPLSISMASPSPVISIAEANTTTAGYLTAADWNTFNGKQPAGSYVTAVAGHTLATGKVWLGVGNVASAEWFGIDDLRTAAGLAQFTANCTASQTLTWSALTDAFVCANIDGLNANKITGGVLDVARLGSGTADNTKYLRGDSTWQTLPSGADHLGNHTATQNLNLATFKLVGNGGSSGLSIDSAGAVGVGTTSPGAAVEIDTNATTQKGQLIKGIASQTATLSEWQDSTNAVIASVAADGSLSGKNLKYSSTSVALGGSNGAGAVGALSNAVVLGSSNTNLTHNSTIVGTSLNQGSFASVIMIGQSQAATATRQVIITPSNSAGTNSVYLGRGPAATNVKIDTVLYGGADLNQAGLTAGDLTLAAGYNTSAGFGGNLTFQTGDAALTEKMRIQPSGNVGIGTTSPASPLEVAGLVHSTAGGFKFPDGSIQTTATSGAGVTWISESQTAASTTSSASYVNIGNMNAVNISVSIGDVVHVALSCEVRTGGGLSFYSVATSGVSISSTDGLDMSTTSASYVRMGIYQSVYALSAGTLNLRGRFSDGSGTSSTAYAQSCTLRAAKFGGGSDQFWGLNGTSLSYNTGSVGIGTTSPAAKLDVAGGVKIANDAGTCNSTLAGTMRFTGGAFQGCDGTNWVALGGSSVPSGTHCGRRTVYCTNVGGIGYDNNLYGSGYSKGNTQSRACNGTTLTATCGVYSMTSVTCPAGYSGNWEYVSDHDVDGWAYMIYCTKD